MASIQLSRIVAMGDPHCVFAAVSSTLQLVSSSINLSLIEDVFADIFAVYEGRNPAFRPCNTEYHDLQHVTDVFLATARLIHGASVQGVIFSGQEITYTILASLLHDIGYIQKIDDIQGTGAKYTDCHVQRSIDFMRNYLTGKKLTMDAIACIEGMLKATDLKENIKEINFPNKSIAELAKIIATADLLGQMADRTYLEKLLFLYREFREGEVQGFDNEFDLLRKTIGFYEFIKLRLAEDLGGADRYMRSHFQSRWGIDEDPYLDGMESHISYLQKVVESHANDYRSCLNRDGLVDRLD